MRNGPIQKLQSEPAQQERGATSNSLEQTTATPALAPERPKLRSNILKKPTTPDMRTATLEARLVKSGVPRDQDFINGLLGQLITAGDMGGQHDDSETGSLFSVIEGYGPRDMVDAMLCSQLGTLQGAIARRVRLVNRIIDPALRDVAVNTLAKLVRAFTAVSDALTRRGRGGSPSFSVGHVSFGEGSQAILANVTQSQGEAAPDEAAPSAPLPSTLRRSQCQALKTWSRRRFPLRAPEQKSSARSRRNDWESPAEYWADAFEPALRCQNSIRQALPIAGRRWQKALPYAWRITGVGRSKRQPKRAQAPNVYARSP
jgi:hypothetical protein